MVASGLPTVYERHAQEMSLLALELLDSVKQHVIPHMPQQKVQLRIGLHSGSLLVIAYWLHCGRGGSSPNILGGIAHGGRPPSWIRPIRSVDLENPTLEPNVKWIG